MGKWEFSKILKREPLVLDGGFSEFLDCFPQFVTDHKVNPPLKNKLNSKPVNSLIDFEYSTLNKFINKKKKTEKVRSQDDEKIMQININRLKKDSLEEKHDENSLIKHLNNNKKPSIDRSIKPANKTEAFSNPNTENSLKDKGILLNKEIDNTKNQTKLLEEQTAEIELKLQILKKSEEEKKMIKEKKQQELAKKKKKKKKKKKSGLKKKKKKKKKK